MLRAALAAALLTGAVHGGIASASAQGVDCLSSGRISMLSVQRIQMPGGEGAGLAINVLLQNNQATTQNFTVNYVGFGRYKATNERVTLRGRQQATTWVVTFQVGGSSVTDDTIRSNVRLTCD
ncbi:hypothetical protein KTR66_03470 [Roseococcus sp. SDR]|uniref:hypothetical protein n=1 Tax=Roseococcus sp. SDR TaxID=2835532 RepID=UPI001BCADE55|nr:hypothetical protein [Roseococcus sp. SDR]MBS7789038.1 hypothetical protein [Roseococcus sp. SDR]MBV1844352.1 hypothetical protein [Roseococcus sp. SDR]